MQNQFGERVRHYRRLRGMSQTQLSSLVGRGHSMLSAIENGHRKVHVDELVIFAEALGVTPMELLGERGTEDRYAVGYADGYQSAYDDFNTAISELAKRRTA